MHYSDRFLADNGAVVVAPTVTPNVDESGVVRLKPLPEVYFPEELPQTPPRAAQPPLATAPSSPPVTPSTVTPAVASDYDPRIDRGDLPQIYSPPPVRTLGDLPTAGLSAAGPSAPLAAADPVVFLGYVSDCRDIASLAAVRNAQRIPAGSASTISQRDWRWPASVATAGLVQSRNEFVDGRRHDTWATIFRPFVPEPMGLSVVARISSSRARLRAGVVEVPLC